MGLDSDLADVVRGDVADDREAEPCAAGLSAAGTVDSVEPLEDALEVALGDADALVRDREVDRASVRRSRHRDDRAFV